MLEVPCCGGGGDCGIPDFFDGRSPNIGHFFFLFAPHFDVAFVHPSSSSLPELDGSRWNKVVWTPPLSPQIGCVAPHYICSTIVD